MFRRLGLSLIALLVSSAAFAQSVIQSGSITPGHAARFISNGVIGDAGTASNGLLTTIGVTNNGGPGICVSSAAPTAAARNQLCFSITTNGGSKISSYIYGTATNPGIVFDINGSVQGFPTVTLPVVNGNLACFDGTTGNLKDCGGGISSLIIANHAVAIGTGSLGLRAASPSTAGIPLVSAGASSDPAFGTAVVVGGGTGRATITAHSVMLGNGTSAVTLVAPATAGYPFVSNGASADPSFNAAYVARYKLPPTVTNFYSNSSATGCTGGVPCLDTNDGLTTGTAKKTVLGALYGILNGYDFTCTNGTQSVAQVNLLSNEANVAGQTGVHYGPHDYNGACAGSSVIVDGGGFTLQYDSGSSAVISAFFGPVFQLQNIKLVNASGVCVLLSEHADIRFGASIEFGNCGISVKTASLSTITFLNNFTHSASTSQTAFIDGEEGGSIIFGAGITGTFSGTPTFIWTMVAQSGAVINLNSMSWAGNVPTAIKYLVSDGGTIVNGAASIPGSMAGQTASGGTVDGAPVAITAGGCGATTAADCRTNLGLSAGATNTTAQEQARLAVSHFLACVTGVNFNSANTDTAIPFTMPTGFTRLVVFSTIISHASASLTTATMGLFPATGAGAQNTFTGASITVSATADNTAANAQAKSGTTAVSYVAASLATPNTLYFRVMNAQGSPATADVCIDYVVML